MEEAGSSAGWPAAARLREQGLSEELIAAEIKSWRASGWVPRSEFTEAMLTAYASKNAGAPESVVADLVEPWRLRYGAGAVAEAFARMSACANRIAARGEPGD